MKQEQQIASLLLDRYIAAQHPLGRLWLNFHVQQQRWRASWLENGAAIIKRGVDIIGSVAALMLVSPLLLLIAILVKLEDRGPIFFAQTRVGQFGREFK